ncbi:GerMN domain-containing protein [Leptolyngbya sp. NIES-2104]|uniref:GerMN domain-containing protein n=1 Tax=Leptolyngbya sp. NIES-2104 TaxID=1552121 RepID=UPI0006EC5286|nr:GerMN domain-containing protein [Leptolyngbya sp. NIES-2104]GAP98365.1 hypothetical protein NIES2104_49200 [Leptolyngbya sp. NIES-2104]
MIRGFLIFNLVFFILSGCRSPEPIRIEVSPSPVASTPKPSPQPTGKTIAINIFQLDNQCNEFVTTKERVPANQPVTQAIAKTLLKANSESLDVAGYRVRVKSGVATIDFRPIPKARRSLTSLANCEQLALFGSVRRTLTQNPALRIKSVRFTDRGQLIKPQ